MLKTGNEKTTIKDSNFEEKKNQKNKLKNGILISTLGL